ncbi:MULTISPECIES: MtrAB system histidine kinase MtrB [Kytococcus]|uniref:MtrAB system histidine kinase MtrB n=1 Tax=Kytococcus TaxID=57499 RepID=UPI0008ADC6BC|nr:MULTISPECIES: MtrAB system histidine kinase MtrB [Kytococcus]OFS13804.1 hypothetical protein HMPREF3099_05445 [Kytococcus sp. HMSC28H12]
MAYRPFSATISLVRAVRRAWRTSLRFRTIVVSLLLTAILSVVLGVSLYQAIGERLVRNRAEVAMGESVTAVGQAQREFDSLDRVDNATLYTTATDVVRQSSSQGDDRSRRVAIVRSPGNEEGLSPVERPEADVSQVPPALRQRLAEDPEHVHSMIARTSSGGREAPTVVVAARLQVPGSGPHDMLLFFSLANEQRTLGIVGSSFALGGLGLIGIAGLITFVVTHLALDPLSRVTRTAEQIATGDLDRRTGMRGHDELGRLGRSVDTMADVVQRQIVELKDLSHLQQRFVSDVSHELRTPLTTIRMASEVLHLGRDDFDAMSSRSVELLHGEVERLDQLLTDLLEISRQDAGQVQLQHREVDLEQLARRVVEAHSQLAAGAGVELRVERPGTVAAVRAEVDERRIERVVRNLVVNAIDHAEQRPVVVTVDGNYSAVAVAVSDTGVGLDDDQMEHVFDRFWRADPARNRTAGGTGLGLSICAGDALEHRGWLQVSSRPGQGATFRLTVPRHAGGSVAGSPIPMPDPHPADAECRRAMEDLP